MYIYISGLVLSSRAHRLDVVDGLGGRLGEGPS